MALICSSRKYSTQKVVVSSIPETTTRKLLLGCCLDGDVSLRAAANHHYGGNAGSQCTGAD